VIKKGKPGKRQEFLEGRKRRIGDTGKKENLRRRKEN
jgi:hypothetical protein